MAEPRRDVERLAAGVSAGDRLELARAVTLIESDRPDDRELAERLVETLLPRAGASLRLAVSGPPGVGKSTLIDVLGREIIARGGRVAVLAVDPSSQVTGGSLLGDKTRMGKLAASDKSFIRPSPSRGVLGGVALRTREVVTLCEAAGYDRVIVETVGVGQSEHDARKLVDVFVLLVAPGAGDELQGMKRGILEVADVVAVNKADGMDRERAERAAVELSNALGLFSRTASAPATTVLTLSALEERGIGELLSAVETSVASAKARGAFATRRAGDRLAWFHEELERALRERWLSTPEIKKKLAELERLVEGGALGPSSAARMLLDSAPASRPPGGAD
jgi:LAO/AO transport system kinase